MDPTWYIHNKADICFDKESFIDYQPFKNSQVVFLSDNTTHKIYGKGMVTIKLLNGIKKKSWSFTCSWIKQKSISNICFW
jgi:hypothetical protein